MTHGNTGRPGRIKRITYYAVTLLVLAGCTEAVLRIGWADTFRPWNNEINTAYHHHERLGWFPTPGFSGQLKGSNVYTTHHNSDGFRDREHGKKTKPRILFVGDSFVYGYDVNEGERFTDLVASQLPDWEVLNIGVSGYGPPQEFLLLQQYMELYQPDAVFQLLEYSTDGANAASNCGYGGYYRPYYTHDHLGLALHGVPVPKGIRYFQNEFPVLFSSYLMRASFLVWMRIFAPQETIENPPVGPTLSATKHFVEQHGARYMMGLTGTDAQGSELQFCRTNGIPCVALLSDKRFPNFGKHWTSAGHVDVVQQLLPFLREQGL